MASTSMTVVERYWNLTFLFWLSDLVRYWYMYSMNKNELISDIKEISVQLEKLLNWWWFSSKVKSWSYLEKTYVNHQNNEDRNNHNISFVVIHNLKNHNIWKTKNLFLILHQSQKIKNIIRKCRRKSAHLKKMLISAVFIIHGNF